MWIGGGRVALLAASAGAALALAACGTTVPQTTSVAAKGSVADGQLSAQAAGLGGDGTTGTPGQTSAVASALPAEPGQAGNPAAVGSAPAASVARPTLGVTATQSSAPVGKKPAVTRSGGKTGSSTRTTAKPTTAAGTVAGSANGPGVTASTIAIGFVYATGQAEEQAALGAVGESTVDPKQAFQTTVDDINKTGGIAGRQLIPVYYSYSASDNETNSQHEAEICANFTQDTHVLAVFGYGGTDLSQCLAKSGVLNPASSINAQSTDAELAALSNVWDVTATSLDTLAKNLVTSLFAENYFSAWNTTTGAAGGVAPVKVGIIGPNLPDIPGYSSIVNNILVPELRARGLTVNSSDVILYNASTSSADAGSEVAAISSAELQMASDGVTHVLPIEINSLVFFSQTANTQNYHPRYGISTIDYVTAAGSEIPSGQLNGAEGFGFVPSADIPLSASSAPQYAGPGAAHCLAVYKAAGIDLSSATNQATAFSDCDSLYSLRAAMNAVPAGSPLTVSAIVTGLKSLGASFAVSALPAVSFGGSKVVGAEDGWRMAYNTGCTCVQYTSAAFSIG